MSLSLKELVKKVYRAFIMDTNQISAFSSVPPYSFSSPSIDYTRTCFDFFSSPSLLSPPLPSTRACFDFFSSPSLFSSLPFAKSGLAKSPFGRPSAGGFLGRCRRCSRIFLGALVSPRYPLSVSDSRPPVLHRSIARLMVTGGPKQRVKVKLNQRAHLFI